MQREVGLPVTVHLNPLVAPHRRSRVQAAGLRDVLEHSAHVPQDAGRASLPGEEEVRLLVAVDVPPLRSVDAGESGQAGGDGDVLEVAVALVEEQGDRAFRGHDEGVRLTVVVVVVPEEVLRRLDEIGNEQSAEDEVHGEPIRRVVDLSDRVA